MKNKKGFTLAEVLITLGIIGVVAALTIPILVNSYQKTQYVTGLKKAYTEWNQALIQMAADNGCVGDLQCTGLFASDRTPQDFVTEFLKYFKVVKNCGPIVGGTGCFSNKVSNNYDGSGGRTSWYDSATYYRFITADGLSFVIFPYMDNCEQNFSATGDGNLSQICGDIAIDVNGPTKGPNNFGRDIFKFFISNGKGPLLYPAAGPDDADVGYWKDVPLCSSGDIQGLFCAARIMEEGWKMNY